MSFSTLDALEHQYYVNTEEREGLILNYQNAIQQRIWRHRLMVAINSEYSENIGKQKYNIILSKVSAYLVTQQNFGIDHKYSQQLLNEVIGLTQIIVPQFELDMGWLNSYKTNIVIEPSNWWIRVIYKDDKVSTFTFSANLSSAIDSTPDVYECKLLDKYYWQKPLFETGDRALATECSRLENFMNNGFQILLSKSKLKKLIQLSQSSRPFENPLLVVLRMLLRYQYLFIDTGIFLTQLRGFWEYYEKYVMDNHPEAVLIEGFAYSLNNNFSNFFSLYTSEDAPFGSIGNFFKTDLLDHPWRDREIFMAINPPYVETTLRLTSRIILYYLNQKSNFTAVITWPFWLKEAGPGFTDEPSLRELLDLPSSILRWVRLLKKDDHNIYDQRTDSETVSSYSEIVLMVSNNPHVSMTLSDVEPYMF